MDKNNYNEITVVLTDGKDTSEFMVLLPDIYTPEQINNHWYIKEKYKEFAATHPNAEFGWTMKPVFFEQNETEVADEESAMEGLQFCGQEEI